MVCIHRVGHGGLAHPSFGGLSLFIHRRMNRIMIGVATVAATIAAVSGCSASPSGTPSGDGTDGGTIDIIAGVAATPSATALLLGIQQGFFADEGINIKTQPIATGAAAVTQLINGQIQIALGGLSGTITAVSQGIPVVFVSGGVTDKQDPAGSQYETLVSSTSGIKSFKDLAGKKVALNSVNCCWDFWTREAVAADGGDQSKLQMVQLPFAQQVSALQSGAVDAITTQQPFAKQAEQAGFVSLGDPAAIAYGSDTNGNTDYFSAKSFIDAHPGFAAKWRAALQKSSDYANAHPDEVRASIVSVDGMDQTLAAAAPVPNYSAELDTDAIQKEASWLVKYKVIQGAAPDVSTMTVP